MNLVIEAEKAPIAVDADGVARVAGTRVTLDTIVLAFEHGAAAEEIAIKYPSVGLADIYAVIGYYLHQQDAVREYLKERQALAKAVQEENERRFPTDGLRARLMARRRDKPQPE